jgi:hypothetical protein
MKKLLLIATITLIFACSPKSDCNYSKVEITSQIDDNPLDKKVLEGCFSVSEPDEMGLIEITDADNRIKVSYFKETDPNSLKMLNLKFGNGNPIEWRTKKGHDLFIIQKKDSLGFIFGDRNNIAGKIKGSLLFIK